MTHIRRLRVVAILVLFMMLFNGLTVFADEASGGKLIVSNNYIRFSVNADNGRFAISTVKGSVDRAEDDEKPLLYEQQVPDTSFTTFKIDGQEYIFGNDYSFLGLGNNFISTPASTGLLNQSVWSIKGVEITQSIMISGDEADSNAGNVKIRYLVKNKSGKEIKIGTRILMDTLVGGNDAAPVILPGRNGYISTETSLTGSQLPIYWKAVDDVNSPGTVSYGLLNGWGNTSPDRITFAHWESLSGTKWNYTPNAALDFTSSSNIYGKADSAAALTWDETALGASQERVYETYYGIGDFSTENPEVNFTAKSYGPQKLTVNDSGDSYNEKEFSVGLQIDNTYTQSQTLTNVKAKIEFSYGLKLAAGETSEKILSAIDVNEVKNIGFRLTALPHYKTGLPFYKITLSADGMSKPIEKTGSLLIPSLTGEPPEISFTSFAPASLYSLDDKKKFTILGKGFDLLSQDENYRVVLKNVATGEETVVPSENVVAGSESMTVSIPNTLTNACKQGMYQISVRYSYQGVDKSFGFNTNLAMTNQEAYKVREYKVLQILRSKVNNEYTYSIKQSETDNAPVPAAGTEVLLEFRGNIQKNGDVYTVADRYTFINSCIKFDYNTADTLLSPSSLTITKKPADLLHQESYISVTGSGKLFLAAFPFALGGFSIELEDKTMYTVEPEKKGEEAAQRIEIVPTFVGFRIPNIEGLPITVKKAVIGKSFVSFGGALDFGSFLTSMTSQLGSKKKSSGGTGTGTGGTGTGGSGTGGTGGTGTGGTGGGKEEQEEDFSVEFGLKVDEIRFGVKSGDLNTVVFEGIKAGGKVGIPKDLTSKIVPGMSIGASLEVEFDTFDNYKFSVAAGFDFFVVQGDASISIKQVTVGNVMLFCPDSVEISGGSNEPGIPIIPVMPVAYLTKLGGGFDGLYDTVTGNFSLLPPLTLKAIAGFNIAKIFSADKITLAASLRGLSLKAEKMKIAKLDILKEVSLSLALEDSLLSGRYKYDMKGTAKIDIFQVLVGEGTLYFGVDSQKNGNLGPVSLGGNIDCKIQVPPNIPFIGGMQLLGASAGISDENVYAHTQILWIPIGIKYVWGSDAPIITATASGTAPYFGQYLAYGGNTPLQLGSSGVQCLAYVNDEGNRNSHGVMLFGDNIRFIDFSTGRKQTMLAAAGGRDYPMYNLAAAGSYEYKFNTASGQKYGLLQAAYDGEVPNLVLTDPSGNTVPLVEGTNYMQQTIAAEDSDSGEIEKRIFISLLDPAEGQWTLASDRELNLKVMDVLPIPELASAAASMENGKIKASWSGADMGDATLSFYLCKNNMDDAGTLIAEGIESSANEAVLDVPGRINSGEYYLRAQLEGEGKTYTSLYASGRLTITDPHQPANPGRLEVTPAGDGLLDVSWDASSDAEGYYIEVFDSGNKSQGIIEIKDGSATSQIIGGKYAAHEDESSGENEAGGIIPGQSYKIALTAYKTLDGILHATVPLESGSVFVPEPDPAVISVIPEAIDGQLQERMDENGLPYYLVNKKSVNLKFTSDQEVESVVNLNGEDKYTAQGKAWNRECSLEEGDNIIYVYSTNSDGDTSKTAIKIKCDTTAPELKVDYPQPGSLSSGNIIRVRGFTEIGSTVTVNGMPVKKGADYIFETEVDMGQDISKDITIIARDEASNETIYKTTVFNSNLEDIQKVSIKGENDEMGIGDEQQMTLWAVDKSGKEVRLNQNEVEWELLSGSQSASISSDGRLKALSGGTAVAHAVFAVTEDYSYEDAVLVKIGGEEQNKVKSLLVSPSEVAMKQGEERQLEASLLYEDMSSRSISAADVRWEIVTGDSCIRLSSGVIKALKNGSAVIRASYPSESGSYTADVLVTVSGKDQESGTISDADKKVLDVLSSIDKNGKTTTFTCALKADIKAGTGKAQVKMDSGLMEDMTGKVKTNEAAGRNTVVEIKVNAPQEANAVELEIPRSAFDKLAAETKARLKIDTGFGSVTFDAEAVKTISGSSSAGNIVFSVARADISQLSEEIRKKIGDRPVLDFTVQAGEKEISDFGDGSARIGIPYTPKPGEDKEAIVVYYIDMSGKLTTVKGRYDEDTGMAVFVTDHFSRYAVGYNKVQFKDIAAGAWYKTAVGFIAARGITTGDGSGSFKPNDRLTRGQFLVMLMRAYNIAPDENPSDNFADAGNTYYTGYLAAAKRLGMTQGVGNNHFAPENTISRQEMFTLLYRTPELLEELPQDSTGKTLASFTDAQKVASWAREAMSVFTLTGVISGNGGMLQPQATATRAEMAQVLYKLLSNN